MIHKTTRSILSVLLAVLLLVTSIPLTPAFADGGAVSPPSESGEGPFAGGTGTADDPYQIATAEELWDFAELVNGGKTTANAVLTADINLNPGFTFKEDGSYSGPAGVDPQEWTPIGTSINNPYEGTFNGAGHTISGLYINRSDNDQGLFGYLSTDGDNIGTVQNLTVSGSVKGDDYVGGIVGYNFSGTVTNCAFSGSVSGNSYVGGVVGVVGDSSGSVKNCYNTGAVSSLDSGSGNSVGGVVGYNDIGGSVTNCYNTGSVNGSIEAGGVVGSNSLSATVTNCYNTGEVSGMYVGGVVGYNDGPVKNCYNTGSVSGSIEAGGVVGRNDEGHVTNCYNIGKVTGSSVGGVVGNNDGSVTNCYFLQGTAGSGIGNEGSAAGAAVVNDLTNQNEFKGWDFDNTWRISTDKKHPVLQANAEDNALSGTGKQEDPYKIYRAIDLKNFRDLVNRENGNPAAWAVLMENITLNSSKEWTPIGNSFSNSYSGTFNGDGHTISGLYIDSSDVDYKGLFGRVNGGTVQDLTVSGSVSGHWYVGGVVGYNNGGNVTGCTFSGSGTVTGSNSVGGVVGLNFGGTVENCYNIGNVSGGTSGGVVGGNGGTVENCYNIGDVSGNSYVGGVVGNNISSVTNCYFLQTETVNKDLQGIGGGSGISSNVEARTDTAFHSGEVAWLLQSKQTDESGLVWGQTLGGEEDSLPSLVALDKNAKTVYQVTLKYDYAGAQDKTYYTDDTATPSEQPSRDGYTFDHWDKTEGEGNTITYTAQWTPVEEPDPEPEEPPYTGKYSYELSTSVGDHGAISVDRYATEGDKVTIDVTPDQAYKLDDLSVTAGGKDVELTANSDGTYTFTMPSADVRITATFAEDPDWTEPEEPATDVSDLFIDIAANAWYKDAVQYAYDNGLMTGVSATEFAPEATTTRAMIVSILARLEGVESAEAAGFADVTDEWYATAVNWAANVGVVNGYEDNTFRPNTAITREQLAAILMNYAAYKGEDVSNRADLANYTDQPSIWAEEAMSWAVAEGLISGVTNDQLQPQSSATRAQVAAILQRYLEA